MEQIVLRKMLEKDIERIYNHIHLNYIRKYFPEEEKKQWEAHRRWYTFVLNSPSYLFYTVENLKKEFLGTVKFELEETRATISIYLTKNFRGHGFSERLVLNSIQELICEKPYITKISAYILEENEISKKVFTHCGFLFQGIDGYYGTEHLLYEMTINNS